MEFVVLTEEEYNSFAYTHKYATFYQDIKWAKLKKINGWDSRLLGVKKNNQIVCASLFLEKKMFLNKKMFYSPRGFLLDYNDYELLDFFTKNLKKYLKKENAIFVKIDPEIIYKERDIKGEIVSNGLDNTSIVNNLINLGYIKNKSHLQPKFVFTLNIDKDYEIGFDTRVKRSLKKCINMGIEVLELDKENMIVYKKIMEHTSLRRGFIDRPLSYYEDMKNTLNDDCIVLISYLNKNITISKLNEDINELEKNISKLNLDSKNYSLNKSNYEKTISNKKKEIEKLSQINEDKIPISGGLFIYHNKELVYLFGGSYSEYMEYPSQYLIQYTAINKAKSLNCTKFNFYGIDGFNTNKDMKGVYEFKAGFGGVVEEYIGEYDLPINKFWFSLYNICFNIYHKLKMLKFKLKK